MAEYKVSTEISGYNDHLGWYEEEATGTVELSDEEVQQLIELIRKNDGETDVKEIELEENLPEIFEKLDTVCCDASYGPYYKLWVLASYHDGYLDCGNDYDDDDEGDKSIKDTKDVMAQAEAEGLFKYEPEDPDEEEDEDEKLDAFEEWFAEYIDSLNDDEKVKTLVKFYGEAVEPADCDYEYTVEIPYEICKMAWNK